MPAKSSSDHGWARHAISTTRATVMLKAATTSRVARLRTIPGTGGRPCTSVTTPSTQTSVITVAAATAAARTSQVNGP